MKGPILKFNINQLTDQNIKCADVLAIMFDFNHLESQLYFHLLQNGKKTVNQLCKEINRDNSTISRALQKLVSLGICTKQKQNLKPKGYRYIFSAMNPKFVKGMLFNRLELIYKCTNKCIQEFDTKSVTCKIDL
jgi:predicted transcriptional regulator